jgi:hypothetical protein
MKRSGMISVSALIAALFASAPSAHAQEAPITTVTVHNAPPPEPYVPLQRDRVYEASFMIGVPIWFTTKNVVQPGVSFETRFARRFGLVAPELTLGWQVNWLNEDKLPNALQYYNFTIDSFYMTLGARVYFVEKGPIQPFISAGFDLAFWHYTGNSQTVCGYYYCVNAADYDVGIGFSGRLGVAFVPADTVAFELGARIAMALPVGPIRTTEGWVSPYIGFTSRF